jgi:hypothetical protein
VIGLCVLRGLRSCDQPSFRITKEVKDLNLTTLSAAHSIFAAHGSELGEARRATGLRTEIDAFRYLVATFEYFLDAFSQIFIFAFLVLYSQEFKYHPSTDSGD